MQKLYLLFTSNLKGERDAIRTEDEINRVLADLRDSSGRDIISVQVDELGENGELRLWVLTR